MAYNRKNLLQRMIDIQQVYREHKKNGATDRWIFRNVIEEQYRISERTFYNYLTTPAKRELANITNVEQQQMQLFG